MARERRRPATIVDVALAAHVSVGTVSRLMNGLPVRPENREGIERAISTLGYRRNVAAASIKSDRTHMVGFMCPMLDDFNAMLLEQLTRTMRSKGRAVLAFNHGFQSELIREALDFFSGHRVDALIVNGESTVAPLLRRYAADENVVVLYDNDIKGFAADRVFVDNRDSSGRLADHLISLGHRRVAVICGHLDNTTAQQRLEGFEAVCAAKGVALQKRWLVDGAWTEGGGYQAMQALMTQSVRPTAVFSSNYLMTLGALTWLQDSGLKVPRDVSLVSFDDSPAMRLHHPGITVVSQPVDALAAALTNVVDDRLKNRSARKATVLLNCDITFRASTRIASR